MQGRREEVTGGVYNDIRRGLPTTEKAAGGPLSFAVGSGDDDARQKAQAMAEERVEARKNKDWAKADELRDSIAELGYTIQDTPQGPVLIPIKDA